MRSTHLVEVSSHELPFDIDEARVVLGSQLAKPHAASAVKGLGRPKCSSPISDPTITFFDVFTPGSQSIRSCGVSYTR